VHIFGSDNDVIFDVQHDSDNDVLLFKDESFFAPVLAKKDSERAEAVKKWPAKR
jgi:hypothetical protein